MKRLIFASLLAIAIVLALIMPIVALAQVVRMPVDSPWTIWSADVKHSFAASPLQLNSVGSLTAISGQRVAIGVITFQQPSVTVTFKGPAATSTTGFRVVGIRAHHEAAALNMSMPEHPINWLLPAPLLVPPGQPFTCRYDMPLIGSGELICAIGKVVPTTTTPPPPPPPPPPPHPPPPTTTVSPAGSMITAPTGTRTTAAGTWTFGTATSVGGNAILLNGQPAAGGFGAELHVKNLGKLYTFTKDLKWFLWSGIWNQVAAP